MVKRIGIVLVLAWVLSVGTEQCSVPRLLSGVAFADFYQQDGKPCPPECVTDTLEIMTWYPSPWNSYEELYTMKLGVGDVTTGDGESHLRPKTVGSIKVERSVVFKPMAEDPVPEKDLYTGEYTNVEQGEMIYNSGEDKFKYFNGQAWVPQTGGSSGNNVIYTSCAWAYDYREGIMSVDANNYNVGNPGNNPALGRVRQSWSCVPKTCSEIGLVATDGWMDLGVIINEPLSVGASSGSGLGWDSGANTHPDTVGRSVRACMKQ